jgi:hypothetical protein
MLYQAIEAVVLTPWLPSGFLYNYATEQLASFISNG